MKGAKRERLERVTWQCLSCTAEKTIEDKLRLEKNLYRADL